MNGIQTIGSTSIAFIIVVMSSLTLLFYGSLTHYISKSTQLFALSFPKTTSISKQTELTLQLENKVKELSRVYLFYFTHYHFKLKSC